MMKKNIWLDVIIIIAWTALFGIGAFTLNPNDWLFEFAAVISGASLGLLIAWGIRYMTDQLKQKH